MVVAVGVILLAVGLCLDAGYHLLPDSVSDQLGLLVGPGGERAHLVTALGFGVLLFAVLSATLLSEAQPR